jgi:hypothetical protein
MVRSNIGVPQSMELMRVIAIKNFVACYGIPEWIGGSTRHALYGA